MKLTQALKQSPEYIALPQLDQELFFHMANLFATKADYLTMNHYELAAKIPSTNPDIWQDFLSLTAVEHWIRSQLSFNAQVAFRKAQRSLVTAAEQGNVSAAKSVTEISGLFDQEQANRQVVLTYVPRSQEGINAMNTEVVKETTTSEVQNVQDDSTTERQGNDS